MTHPIEILAGTSHMNDVLFTADSSMLISAGMDNLIKLWDVPTWEQVGEIAGHENSVNMLSLSPAEDLLVTGSSDKTVRIWDFPGGKQRDILDVKANSAHLSPNGKWLATTADARFRMFDFETLKVAWEMKTQKRDIHALKFSPKRNTVTVAGMNSPEVRFFDPATGEPQGAIEAHDPFVMSFDYTPDEVHFASTGYDGNLKIWKVKSGTLLHSHELDAKGMMAVSTAPDNDTVVVSLDHQLLLFSIKEEVLKKKIELKPKGVYQTDFSPDGAWLALASADKRVRVWDMKALGAT
ncbi:MAG: WD40 repeat domain-containing protein [Anaerolineales bacterium]